MIEITLFDIVFFGTPVILLVLFCISICRYISAKKQNKQAPGTFTKEEVKKRKVMLIVVSVVVGTVAVIFLGIIALAFMAVAYM